MSNTNSLVRSRQLWGNEVYTQDSDLLAVLMHQGFFNQQVHCGRVQCVGFRIQGLGAARICGATLVHHKVKVRHMTGAVLTPVPGLGWLAICGACLKTRRL